MIIEAREVRHISPDLAVVQVAVENEGQHTLVTVLVGALGSVIVSRHPLREGLPFKPDLCPSDLETERVAKKAVSCVIGREVGT